MTGSTRRPCCSMTIRPFPLAESLGREILQHSAEAEGLVAATFLLLILPKENPGASPRKAYAVRGGRKCEQMARKIAMGAHEWQAVHSFVIKGIPRPRRLQS